VSNSDKNNRHAAASVTHGRPSREAWVADVIAAYEETGGLVRAAQKLGITKLGVKYILLSVKYKNYPLRGRRVDHKYSAPQQAARAEP
jgi:sugar diacid utilization regulator